MNNPKITGQILPSHQHGKWLTKLAVAAENIVEIGTWWGGGSTLCIENGITRRTQRFWSIEENHDCVLYARQHSQCPNTRFIWAGANLPREYELLMEELPELIDLLLIDGGNNGMLDFEHFQDRCKVIAVDDANMQKGKDIREQVLTGKGWSVLLDDRENRNGFMVIERI